MGPTSHIGRFDNYGEAEFSRAGNVASETIKLDAGPLPQFSHAIEPHLRKIGMPTSLKRGIVTLDNEFVVCRKGVALSPEQAQALKLLGRKLSKFEINLTCHWMKDGGVTDL